MLRNLWVKSDSPAMHIQNVKKLAIDILKLNQGVWDGDGQQGKLETRKKGQKKDEIVETFI